MIKTNFKNLWRADNTFLFFIIALIGIVISIISKEPISAVLSMSILFTCFDSFGYWHSFRWAGKQPHLENERLAAYRNNQLAYQAALGTVLYLIFKSVWIPLAWTFLHFMLFHDMLFYLFTKQWSYFINLKEFKWFHQSIPKLIVKGLFDKKLSGKFAIWWVITGLLISFSAIYINYYLKLL